ncbi:Nicotinate-nucleotide adenylyltransferase [Chitinispirillum alkaliphilum]|nr:Nicotinate-nucleotide adenylyltransferase [Chitinispirillum alkaliphilum]
MSDSPLGILGGTFDPVHNGHLATACLAIDYFKLEKLLLIPCGNPPHKNSSVHASPDQRLKMLEIALLDTKSMEIWDGEVFREGFSFTHETLGLLRQKYPERPLYFIIGSDNLPQIKTWKSFEKIIEMVVFCVAYRPGNDLVIPAELKDAKIKHFPSPKWELSSSDIREYFKSGYSCSYLVPESVLGYIAENKIYGTAR